MEETQQDSAGVIGIPPLIYAGPLVGGLLLHRARPAALLPHQAARRLGAIAVVAGSGMVVWGMSTMRRTGTPIDPRKPTTHLITSGPFHYSRNPIYTAFAFLYVGASLLANSRWPIFVLPGVLAVMRRGVIAREELYLERTFGEEYTRYRAHVRRWL